MSLDVWFPKDIRRMTDAIREAQHAAVAAAGGAIPAEYIQGCADTLHAVETAAGVATGSALVIRTEPRHAG